MTQIPTSALKIVEYMRENVPHPGMDNLYQSAYYVGLALNSTGVQENCDAKSRRAFAEWFAVSLKADPQAAIDLIWGRKEG